MPITFDEISGGLRCGTVASPPGPTTCAPQDLVWSIQTPANSNDYRSVAYGGGVFAAVSHNGTNRVMTSSDGISWTERTMTTGLFALEYGNGRFVGIQTFTGGRTAVVSEDGETWNTYANALPSGGDWRSVVYGHAGFVAVDGEGSSRVAISPDGITWTAVNVQPDVPGGRWTKIAYGNGRYAAIRGWGYDGTGPSVMTSTDGINWVGQAATDGCGGQSMAYDTSGGFVSAGCWGTWLIRSVDGITWTLGGWSGVQPEFNNISFGEDIGYVGISGTHTYYSTDGLSWARQAVPAGWGGPFDANASAYGNGIFVAVRENAVLRGACPG
ncbi:MAG: hypothetical protein ACK4VI_08490 [Alphaproteobacteria bacterium]